MTYVQNIITVPQAQPTRGLPSISKPSQSKNPQSQIPKTQPSQSQKNTEPVIIVVPYSSPSASESDFESLVRALKEQRGRTLDAPTFVVSNGNASTPSLLSLHRVTRPEVTFSENADERIIGKQQNRTEIEAVYMKNAATTSEESTSTPRWIPPSVVEVGLPVDITDPASYESIRAYMNGDWAHVERTGVQKKAALAQAESEREAILAYLQALREAREAGICDAVCEDAFSALQRDLPETESRIDALETSVQEDVAPRPVPPPSVAQISRLVESLAEPTYEPSASITPRNPTATPAVADVASQETPTPSGETRGEATVLRVVKGVWNFMKSWFLPSPQAQAPREACSLFLSLLGKCK